ncbi:MAG TPA: ATP-binding protein [Acidimicrobiales bacterium]|nr:ATP-binding protein [Acidimicrobiales bacterium]
MEARRSLIGFGVGVAGVALCTLVLLPFRSHLTRATPALVLVLPVMVAAIIGGIVAAIGVAMAAATAFTFVFIPPVGTFRVALHEDVVALVAFIGVAVIAGWLVAREVERRRSSERHRAELLEAVDHQRAALLRSVSHDLRTPLAMIRLAASDLRSDPGYDATRRAELLDSVTDETERLDRIVANILSLSRIEAGAFQPSLDSIDIGELIEHTTARLRRLLAHHDLRVEIPDDLPLVDADYSQIDQVVTNLLENSARHTPPGTAIEVRARRDGDRVTIAIADNGPGIDPAIRDSMFEPFRSPRHASTGIGLSICSAIIEAHGGTLRLCDDTGDGACFELTLPVHH